MRRKAILSGLIFLLILSSGGIFIIHRNSSDYVFVDRTFRHQTLPPELYLVSKEWNDFTKDDASLGTMWAYGFSLHKSERAITLKQDIESAFVEKGFTVSENSYGQSPGDYEISMTSPKITIYMSISYDPSSGIADMENSVGMDVRRTGS